MEKFSILKNAYFSGKSQYNININMRICKNLMLISLDHALYLINMYIMHENHNSSLGTWLLKKLLATIVWKLCMIKINFIKLTMCIYNVQCHVNNIVL